MTDKLVIEIDRGPDAAPDECGKCRHLRETFRDVVVGAYEHDTIEVTYCVEFDKVLGGDLDKPKRCRACLDAKAQFVAMHRAIEGLDHFADKYLRERDDARDLLGELNRRHRLGCQFPWEQQP